MVLCYNKKSMEENKANQLNPLSLAFVGDAVFTLFVRTKLAVEHDNKAGTLHLLANRYVKATAQATIEDTLAPLFTQRESDIARRARNHHNSTKAKNATLADYKKATAFEAVLGYLTLTDQHERAREFMEKAIEIIDTQGDKNE